MRSLFIIILILVILPEFGMSLEKEPLIEEPQAILEKIPLNEPLLVLPLSEAESREQKVENPKPQTPDFLPRTPNLKPQTSSSELRTSNSEPKTRPKKIVLHKVIPKREEWPSPRYFKEERLTTVGEMVEEFLPEAIKGVDPSFAILGREDERAIKPSQAENESTIIAPVSTTDPSIKRVKKGAQNRISLIITSIGLAGLIGFGGYLFIVRLRPQKSSSFSTTATREAIREAAREATREEREAANSSDLLIYKGWWQDDITRLWRVYKETIKDLGQKVETRILNIEDNQTRLSNGLTEIERKMERINLLINDQSRSEQGSQQPSYKEVIRLSRAGMTLDEIARETRRGKGEIELILKNLRTNITH